MQVLIFFHKKIKCMTMWVGNRQAATNFQFMTIVQNLIQHYYMFSGGALTLVQVYVHESSLSYLNFFFRSIKTDQNNEENMLPILYATFEVAIALIFCIGSILNTIMVIVFFRRRGFRSHLSNRFVLCILLLLLFSFLANGCKKFILKKECYLL